MLGPLLAFGLLLVAPLQFDAIFVVSFCFALLGLGVLVLFVRESGPDGAAGSARRSACRIRAAAGLMAIPRVPARS